MDKCNGNRYIKRLPCHKDNTPKLKSRVSKKVLEEAQKVVDSFGYWSTEFSDYIAGFEYEARNKIHNAVKR